MLPASQLGPPLLGVLIDISLRDGTVRHTKSDRYRRPSKPVREESRMPHRRTMLASGRPRNGQRPRCGSRFGAGGRRRGAHDQKNDGSFGGRRASATSGNKQSHILLES